MSSIDLLLCKQGGGEVLPFALELLLEPFDFLVHFFRRDGDLLPGQEHQEKLGVDDVIDSLAIDAFLGRHRGSGSG